MTTREAPHKQNYDQSAYPQAELRPGSWLAGWLAELAGWLAGWLGGLAGWLAPRKAQRGPERHREAERGYNKPVVRLAGAPHKQIYDQGGSPQADLQPGRLPTSRFTNREAPHRFLYGTQEEAHADYH